MDRIDPDNEAPKDVGANRRPVKPCLEIAIRVNEFMIDSIR